jgi:hypothetical protein
MSPTIHEIIKLMYENQELFFKVSFNHSNYESIKERLLDMRDEALIINTCLKELELTEQVLKLNKSHIEYKLGE